MAWADDDAVTGFLAALGSETQKRDAERLAAMMADATGAPARLWPGKIVGFGQYHYRYDSGREGDTFLVGFSPRKPAFSIYLACLYSEAEQAETEDLLSKLGTHSMGKGCLYVKRLSDVDETVLARLITLSVASLRRRYPEQAAGARG